MKNRMLFLCIAIFLLAFSVNSFAWSAMKDSIVISELTWNSYSSDNEWAELYNASRNPVDLTGWLIIDAGEISKAISIPDTCANVVLNPGEYFTIFIYADGIVAKDRPLRFKPDLNTVYDPVTNTKTSNWNLANGAGDLLRLFDSDTVLVDSVNFYGDNRNLFPIGTVLGIGLTTELISPELDRLDPTSWQHSMIYFGTPGYGPVDVEVLPNIIISEIMYNDSIADYSYEFVELFNAGDVDVNIADWWMCDYSITVDTVRLPDVTLKPGDFYTILTRCDTTTATLGFTPDLDLSDSTNFMDLKDSGDNILLFNAGDTIVTFVKYDDDAVFFPHALNADGKGSSLEIVDVNGVNWDPLNWQASLYGGGSPGALNATPPALVAAEVIAENKVTIEYSEAVDSTKAVAKTNYKVDHGVGNPDTVVWVSSAVVELTLSEIKWDTVYTLAVWNVSDVESGTAIIDSSTITFGRFKPDAVPPVVLAVRAITDSTVFVDFDEEVDSTTAVTLTNYTIDNSIGNPVAVNWLGAQVELALGTKLSLDATYNLTVSGIMDLYENTMTEAVVEFMLKDYRGKIVISEFTWNSHFYDNEFMELYNASDETIDIAGWSLRDEPESHKLLYIPDTCDTEMAPGDFFTIWIFADGLAAGRTMDLHFKPDFNAAWSYTNSVKISLWNWNNSGDIIFMWDEAGRLVEKIDFLEEEKFTLQCKWGAGPTCERIDPHADGNDPANWQASWYYGGSPGVANRLERPVYPKIVINEVMYNAADGSEWIELKNLDEVAVDITGWYMNRDNPTLPKVPFKDGSVLQPGELYTIRISGDSTFQFDMDYSLESNMYCSDGKDNMILFNDDDLMTTYMHYDDNARNYYEFAHCEGVDGDGKSLEYWNWDLENWDPQAWAASKDSAGTPGAENYIYDIVPPVVDSALALSDTTVAVWFNEDVNYTTATNKNNYSIDNGIGNPLYILQEENDKVILFLNPVVPLVEGTTYVVTVTGVRDIEGNEIADNNTASFVGIVVVGIDMADAIPKVFALHNNFPNPFNPITTINYDLPKDAKVRIVIYDLMGREIHTLVNTHQKAGYQTIHWNALDNSGRHVSSGFYFYVMDSDNFHKTQKMLLLK
ncbi:MAG: lamin tail domain-containing protein [Candidatus Marinimicrobia bacterium]|nr:lamin tail domain-containing protein [Candidatus Neomarinimicrobiota bacterium]